MGRLLRGCRRQRNSFQAKFKGRDVFSLYVPRSGVSYDRTLEFILAAVWAGYKLNEFFDLEQEFQEVVVAAYQTNMQIESVLSYESYKKSKVKTPRK